MQSNSENANAVELKAQGVQPGTICPQPWWTAGYNVVSPAILSNNSSKSMSGGGNESKAGQSQLDDGRDQAPSVSKEVQKMKTQLDGVFGHEHQQLQQATSTVAPVMAEFVAPHTQLELGHSIACPPYPHSDPYYGGIMTAYGAQALIHPHLIGVHHTRMPLPLEMAEEPVYVNAKQYHGILRRRQSRAKAELEKKLIKVRKPYLHESRHQHAMRRARGNGGRFLNTKKLDTIATQPNPKESHSGNPSTEKPEEHDIQDMPEQHTSNGCHQQHSGFPMQSFHSLTGDRREEGDCLGQQRGGLLVGQAPQRAVTIQ